MYFIAGLIGTDGEVELHNAGDWDPPGPPNTISADVSEQNGSCTAETEHLFHWVLMSL